MKDIIFLLSIGAVIYVVARIILKEPILPWKSKPPVDEEVISKENKKRKKNKEEINPLEEEEASPFRELFPHVKEVDNHMIRQKDNTFTMMAEVEPVNYFLLDQTEQEGIDAIVETWYAQLNYSVRIYLQNRFVDLTEPIEKMRRIMEDEEDLHHMAREYGRNMIEDLSHWQRSQPRFETKRFLVFDYKVEPSELRIEENDDREEKIVNKAFTELNRRLNTAKSQLRKAGINVQMLTTSGITETSYYGFNRRKATKNFYKDIEEQEQLALYVTADQSASQIVRVKGEIESVQENIAAEQEKIS